MAVYTFNGIHGSLVLVNILQPFLFLNAIHNSRALRLVIRRPLIALLKHPGRHAPSRRSQFTATQLSHSGSTARADDEDLLLAPFASRA
jgi:hypothetical protein